MGIETAADLEQFFDPEGFGEAAVYFPPVGDPVALTVIRDHVQVDLRTGASTVVADAILFDLLAHVVTPEEGGRLSITGSGELFEIMGEPRRQRQGASWSCEAAPVG